MDLSPRHLLYPSIRTTSPYTQNLFFRLDSATEGTVQQGVHRMSAGHDERLVVVKQNSTSAGISYINYQIDFSISILDFLSCISTFLVRI